MTTRGFIPQSAEADCAYSLVNAYAEYLAESHSYNRHTASVLNAMLKKAEVFQVAHAQAQRSASLELAAQQQQDAR